MGIDLIVHAVTGSSRLFAFASCSSVHKHRETRVSSWFLPVGSTVPRRVRPHDNKCVTVSVDGCRCRASGDGDKSRLVAVMRVSSVRAVAERDADSARAAFKCGRIMATLSRRSVGLRKRAKSEFPMKGFLVRAAQSVYVAASCLRAEARPIRMFIFAAAPASAEEMSKRSFSHRPSLPSVPTSCLLLPGLFLALPLL